jgi:hypothetical protein
MNNTLDRILAREREGRLGKALVSLAMLKRRMDALSTLPEELAAMKKELDVLAWEIEHGQVLQ